MSPPRPPSVLVVLRLLLELLPDRFARRRKLGPRQLLVLLLLSLVNDNRPGFRALLQQFDEHFADPMWDSVATSGALARAREKLAPEALRECLRTVVDGATAAQAKSRAWDARFRFIAADATRVSVPRTKSLAERFHLPRNAGVPSHYPQMMLITLWDQVAKLPVAWTTRPCDGNERDGITAAMDDLRPDDVLVCDRNFPSGNLFALLDGRCRFIMRMHSTNSAWNVVKQFLAEGRTDGVVEHRIDARTSVSFRVVVTGSVVGKPVVLATNLSADELSPERIAEAYRMRWAIETAFREFKGRYGLDRLTGRTVQAVEQEIAALMIFQVAVAEMAAIAEAEIRQRDAAAGDTGVPRVVNRRLVADTCRRLLITLASGDAQKVLARYHRSMETIVRFAVRPRPGRHYPKVGKGTYTKWASKARVK